MGIPETVAHVIEQFPTEIQGMFWANIGLIGGVAATEGIGERLFVSFLVCHNSSMTLIRLWLFGGLSR